MLFQVVVIVCVLTLSLCSNAFVTNSILKRGSRCLHQSKTDGNNDSNGVKRKKGSSAFTEEERNNGYSPVGSLLRQGPVPFLIRIAKPDTYEAAVNKYMLLEKCDKITAMANMDAYFQDPNGWAGNKLRSRSTGVDIDYVNMNMNKQSLILTGIWATGITFLFYRIFAVQVLHQL